jgi:hypothetical protein
MGLSIFSDAYLSPAGKKLSQLKMDNIAQSRNVTGCPFAVLNGAGKCTPRYSGNKRVL